ncbi:MAG: hypothetical protein ACJARS_001885 [bacterium]
MPVLVLWENTQGKLALPRMCQAAETTVPSYVTGSDGIINRFTRCESIQRREHHFEFNLTQRSLHLGTLPRGNPNEKGEVNQSGSFRSDAPRQTV